MIDSSQGQEVLHYFEFGFLCVKTSSIDSCPITEESIHIPADSIPIISALGRLQTLNWALSSNNMQELIK